MPAPSATTLLFIDDDSASRHSLGLLLQARGFTVWEAATGTEGLRLARQGPDLVLLDVHLPDLDGFEVCRRLKSDIATADLPVLQLSAHYTNPGDRVQGLEGGADGYLTKPVDPWELLAHIKALMRLRGAERAARRAAREWQATFDAVGDGVCLLDAEGRFLRCNQALAQILGAHPRDLVGRSLVELLKDQPGDVQATSPPLGAPAGAAWILEYPLRGRWYRVRQTPILNEGGHATGTVQVWADLTERKQAEEALRDREARLELLTAQVPAVLWTTDTDLIVTSTAGAALAVVGRQPNQSLGRHLSEAVGTNDPEDPAIAAHLRALQGERASYEYAWRGRAYQVFVRPLRGREEEILGCIGLSIDVTEQKQAEQQVRFQASLLDQVRNSVIALDLDGNIIFWNRFAETLYGWSAGEVLGKQAGAILIPEQALPAMQEARAQLRQAGCWEGDFLVRRRDGQTFTAHVTNSVVRDGQGEVCGFVGVSEDVTEHRRAEEVLRQQAQILEQIHDAVICTDLAGHITGWNSGAERLYGYRPEEVLGKNISLLYPEPGRTFAAGDVVRRLQEQGGLQLEMPLRHQTGRRLYVHLSLSLLRASDGTARGIVGSSIDITERKQAEEELRRQKEILQTIFDHIPLMIRFLAPDGRVLLINRHWEQVLGWSLEEARQRDVFAEIFPDPEYRRQAFDIIRSAPSGWRDFKTRVRDGRTLDTSWANVLLSDGTTIGIGQDVTERKRAEAERERLYREVLASRAQLQDLSRRLLDAHEEERRRIAHELHDEVGQILTVIRLHLHGLREPCGPGAHTLLEEGISAVERAIDQVRNLSLNLRPGQLDVLGLEAALRWYVERQARQTGLEITLDCALSESRLPSTLETTCFRLVQEALTNVARHARAQRVWVELVQHREELHLLVRDDGAGFDVPAARQRALQGGSFGLLGMQERVELLDGQFDIVSGPGQGTQISVVLSVARPSSCGSPATEEWHL